MSRNILRLKYRIAWYILAVISFLLFYSGILPLYIYLLRKVLKKHKAIVLMYHRIGKSNDTPDMTVSVKNFESQIAYLKNNYKIISLDAMVDAYQCNKKFDIDTVTITFDDGFKDNYTHAYPVLKKNNIPAAVFVANCFIGDKEGLSKDDMAIMQKGGITFGAHTVTHKVLAKLDRAAAFREICDSKSALEEILQEKVNYFAYPYGKRGRDFTDETMLVVKDAGLIAAFATDNGFIAEDNDIFALNRIGVRDFPLFVLKARLSGIFENSLIHGFRKCFRI